VGAHRMVRSVGRCAFQFGRAKRDYLLCPFSLGGGSGITLLILTDPCSITPFYFTTAEGIFGLFGLLVGEITRSMSSIETAPISRDWPITNAPVKQLRFANLICTGPTYGTTSERSSARVTSRFSISCNPSWHATCSGIQSVIAPVSTRARTAIGLSEPVLAFANSNAISVQELSARKRKSSSP